MIKAERNGKGTGSVEISGSMNDIMNDIMNEFKGICNGVRKMFVDEFGEDAGEKAFNILASGKPDDEIASEINEVLKDVFMEKEKRMDASDAIGALLRHVFE